MKALRPFPPPHLFARPSYRTIPRDFIIHPPSSPMLVHVEVGWKKLNDILSIFLGRNPHTPPHQKKGWGINMKKIYVHASHYYRRTYHLFTSPGYAKYSRSLAQMHQPPPCQRNKIGISINQDNSRQRHRMTHNSSRFWHMRYPVSSFSLQVLFISTSTIPLSPKPIPGEIKTFFFIFVAIYAHPFHLRRALFGCSRSSLFWEGFSESPHTLLRLNFRRNNLSERLPRS